MQELALSKPMVLKALCAYQLHLCYLLSAYPIPDDRPVHNFLTS